MLLDARCLDCGEPISVEIRDEELLSAQQVSMVGYVNTEFGVRPGDPDPESRGFR